MMRPARHVTMATCFHYYHISQYKVRDLGTCWNDSFRKIFHFNRWESVSEIQHYCGELSFVDVYNKYKAKFLRSIISTDYSPACVRIWTWIDKQLCAPDLQQQQQQQQCSALLSFFIYIFLLCLSSLSVCAILLTVFDFSTYVVNKHLIIKREAVKRTVISA